MFLRNFDEGHAKFARLSALAIVLACMILFAACAKKKHAYAHPGATRLPTSEVGLASWYGVPYHGRAAANGEIYDMEKMTAAHRTLPFGSWVRVTNLANSKSVDLRIIDRGPFIDGRVIDVSHAGAQAIELIGPGVAQVRVDVIAAPPAALVSGTYGVQVGAFQDRKRAERMRTALERDFGTARVVYRDGRPPLWRVLVGNENSLDTANLLAKKLRDQVGSGFVVRLDDTAGE